MTRDAASQAVHERLERAASSMPAFDVEAGWASFAAQLEGPIAPVIPLRRRHPRRVVALAVAAALVIGGSALAMVRNPDAPGLSIAQIAPVATPPSAGLVTGPHSHPAFSGAPPTDSPDPTDHGGGGSEHPSGATDGGTTEGSGGGGSGPNVDSPDDIDHGTGNDGKHDDNGKGNNTHGHDSLGNGDHGGGSSAKSSGH
jgi:hypothetical protein